MAGRRETHHREHLEIGDRRGPCLTCPCGERDARVDAEPLRRAGAAEVGDRDWLRGDKFEYPADYHPSKIAEGSFGLISGPRTRVRIFFDEKVSRFVRRRQWHPSQVIKRVPNGVELTMEVSGTVEVVSWVLGFGDQAEVLEPQALRDQVAAELGRASGRYAAREQ